MTLLACDFRGFLPLMLTAALWPGPGHGGNPPAADLLVRDGFELPQFADIRPLSDEFETPATLGDWRRVWREEYWPYDSLEVFDIGATRAGWMTLVPHTSTWYEDYRAAFAFKFVAGDFIATTRVQARNRGGDGAPGSTSGGPDGSEFSLAGILVRAPREDVVCCDSSWWQAGLERYVFLSFGAANVAGAYQFEVKTTRAAIAPETHSISQLEIVDAGVSEAELRIARLGPYCITLLREPAGTWRVHRRYARSDLPSQLQVGITVYTDWAIASTYPYAEHNDTLIEHGYLDPGRPADPDLRAQFDWFRYARPQIPGELIGADFSDPDEVSDEQLLVFLGEPP